MASASLEGAFSRMNLSQDTSTQLLKIRKQDEKEAKMKKLRSRAFASILSLVMVASVIFFVPVKAEGTTKTAYVTIEKYTIGQGFAMAPKKVEFSGEATVTDILNKVAEKTGIELVYTQSEYGDYLSGIKHINNGVVNIPAAITAIGDIEAYGMNYPAPTNENLSDNTSAEGVIGEYTYTSMAGWMYTVNNEGILSSASDTKVNDRDVIRVQFSIHGWGLDLGHPDFNTGERAVQLANEDALIKIMAEVLDDSTALKDTAVNTAFTEAYEIIQKYDATQEEIDQAYENLAKVFTPKEKPTEQKISVAKAKISAATRVKKSAKKVKVTVKKINGITGYQVAIYKNKKTAKNNKNAIVKKTTKKNVKIITIANKKLKNKKALFVKVRAYKKVSGSITYGDWSNVATVKTKK